MESKLSSVLTAISGFTDSSNPQDEMLWWILATMREFNRLAERRLPATPRKFKGLSQFSPAGATLYDAVAAGLEHLQLAHWQKRALVIISDGGDNSSQCKYSSILAQTRQSQASIYAIGLVDEFGEEENPKILEKLSTDTGGIAFFPRSTAAIVDSTARIAREIREQYMLGCEPTKTG